MNNAMLSGPERECMRFLKAERSVLVTQFPEVASEWDSVPSIRLIYRLEKKGLVVITEESPLFPADHPDHDPTDTWTPCVELTPQGRDRGGYAVTVKSM